MKIGMLGVFTDQIDAMRDFYRDVLGFEVLEDLGGYVEFGGQPVRFAICTREVMRQSVGGKAFDEPAQGCTLELAFECASRDALDSRYNELLAAGAGEVKRPAVMPWGQYAGFFSDPDGNVHELFVHSAATA